MNTSAPQKLARSSPSFSGHTALVCEGDVALPDIAHALADGGARVIVAATDGQSSADGRITPAAHDVFDDTAWPKLFATVDGQIDLVVIGPGTVVGRGFDALSAADFRAAETAHIIRTWLTLKHVLPVLAKAPSAAIAVMIPRAGVTPAPRRIADCAVFGALRSMFKSVVLECGRIAPTVRVNAIIANDDVPRAEVAAAVLHTLSSEAGFMTGAELILGGP